MPSSPIVSGNTLPPPSMRQRVGGFVYRLRNWTFDRSRRRALAVCVVLAVVTLACYWPITANQFISIDDPQYITANSHVANGVTWSGLRWALTSTESCNWHPVTWMSHMIDCQLFGLNPAGHHLTNLVLHAINSILVFLILRRFTRELWPSAFVAALFAWHPLHVESVAWAAERKDVLSGLFFLLTLWAYAGYAARIPTMARVAEARENRGRSALSWYLLALFCFWLGLMSKPMLVTVPFVLLLVDVWPLRRWSYEQPRWSAFPRLLIEKMPFLAFSAGASVITFHAQQSGGAVSSFTLIPLSTRIGNAVLSYGEYLRKLFCPVQLSAVYPYPQTLSLVAIVSVALLLLLLTAALVVHARSEPSLAVGWLWFLGMLVPVIGIVQVGAQAMADRYTYLPSVGLFVAVVWGLCRVCGAANQGVRVMSVAVVTLALVLCIGLSHDQVTCWRKSEALFRQASQNTKDNYIAYDRLASALAEEGKWREAVAWARKATIIAPGYPEAQYDLGTILMHQGRPAEAMQHLLRAVTLKPGLAAAHSNLGKLYSDQGDLGSAEASFSQALILAPEDAEAHYNLGTLLLKCGKVEPAINCLSEAARLDPKHATAHSNLGIALMKQGRVADGAAHLYQALLLEPRDAQAHFNFGLALLELGRPTEAAARFWTALRLDPAAARNHYFLGLALVRENQPSAASAQAQAAHDLAIASGQTDLAAQATELLNLCHSEWRGAAAP